MFITLSLAVSLDGYIDDASDKRLILSNAADWAEIDKLRAASDAILIGAGTLRKDNPSLIIKSKELQSSRIRDQKTSDPIKVVITRSGTLDPTAKFFTTGSAQKVVFLPQTSVSSIDKAHFKDTIWIADKAPQIEPAFIISELEKLGVKKLMIESGSEIAALFLKAGLINEIRIAVAPIVVGDCNAPRFLKDGQFIFKSRDQLSLKSVEQFGDMAVHWYECRE